MRLYKLTTECMASEILTRHGFTLTDPDESLVTNQIWEKDTMQVKFTGWENTPKTALMADNPKYINIEQVN